MKLKELHVDTLKKVREEWEGKITDNEREIAHFKSIIQLDRNAIKNIRENIRKIDVLIAEKEE